MTEREQGIPVEAGPELDALIAEKVFRDEVKWLPTSLQDRVPHYQNSRLGSGWLILPRYSTDIAAAWEVVAKMRDDPRPGFRSLSMVAYCYDRTYATFDADAFNDYAPETWAEANGEHSTPHAICLAALKAVARLSGKPFVGEPVR